MNKDLTAVSGIKVGNAENIKAGTGCTAVLCGENFTIGAEVRGAAPASREIALTASEAMVSKVNAVFLTGGSAFGLDAAAGVMQYLAENNIGFKTAGGVVPIIPAAAIYDLEYKSNEKPDKKMAYLAAKNASADPIPAAAVGAACGAACGKINGIDNAFKTILGHAAIKNGALVTAALAVVNAFGDIKNPAENKIIAGAKDENGKFINTENLILNKKGLKLDFVRENTTLVVVATNAILSKSEANRVAMMAHCGLARTIYPVHTLLDGDTIFTLASNKIEADINQVGTAAAYTVQKAIINSVSTAGG
ncbi:MAG: P1 family peptidase [Halanaerobium sp.]